MTIRTVVVFVLSLLCGLSAAGGAYTLMNSKASEAAPPETTTIVVAAVDLHRGTKIKPELLDVKEWPKGLVPAGAFTKVEDAVDRTVDLTMMQGEPVLGAKVTDKGDGVAAFVKKGMRAFTISTPTVGSSVAGMLLPSNRVDVLLTVSKGRGASTDGTTTTLLQHVEILAVDQQLDSSESAGNNKKSRTQSVTLHVTPDEVAKLTQAQSMGTLTLSLRSWDDETEAATNPIMGLDLLGLEEGVSDADAASASTAAETAEQVEQLKPKPKQVRMSVITLRGRSPGLYQITREERQR